MNMMAGHQQNMMMHQQQMMQQPMMQPGMYPQQMQPGMQPGMYGQPPQRPGIGSALGNFGSSLIRGSLGLPPAQQGYMQQQPPQQ